MSMPKESGYKKLSIDKIFKELNLIGGFFSSDHKPK